MRITTTGGDLVLAAEAEQACSFWARFRGLMLRKSLEPGGGLVIEPCGSIHMIAMRFAIDAVFYDREHRVTKVARNVRPWVGAAWGGRGARGVIELPAGAAAALQAGASLQFEERD